jgi:hypothetical protein
MAQQFAYQYLGMTKIAGALNMLPKTMLRQNITNPSTNEVIKISISISLWGKCLLE